MSPRQLLYVCPLQGKGGAGAEVTYTGSSERGMGGPRGRGGVSFVHSVLTAFGNSLQRLCSWPVNSISVHDIMAGNEA